jgi:fatty-acyl-CoA synthase
MIITGGENVYPAEVEAVLIEHPGVADVAVIGLPDGTWGEAVTAVIIPAADPPDLEELRVFAEPAGRLQDSPPSGGGCGDSRTASGKIIKHRLKAT